MKLSALRVPSAGPTSMPCVAVHTIFSHCKNNCTSFLESETRQSMLYQTYQMHDDFLEPLRWTSRWARAMAGPFTLPARRALDAALRNDLALRAHARTAALRHRDGASRQPRRSRHRGGRAGPALRAAPALRQGRRYPAAAGSGRRPALRPLRHAAARHRQTLLRDHDVYITDWKNARDVPVEDGRLRRRGLRRLPDPLPRRPSAPARISSRFASPASRRSQPSRSCRRTAILRRRSR